MIEKKKRLRYFLDLRRNLYRGIKDEHLLCDSRFDKKEVILKALLEEKEKRTTTK